jgi:hypothetical protein
MVSEATIMFKKTFSDLKSFDDEWTGTLSKVVKFPSCVRDHCMADIRQMYTTHRANVQRAIKLKVFDPYVAIKLFFRRTRRS